MIFKSFMKPATPLVEKSNYLVARETIVVHDKVNSASYSRHLAPLSLKTVLSGEEAYDVHGFVDTVRPGEYMVINGAQPYSSYVHTDAPTESLAIFFSLADVREIRQRTLSDVELLDDPTKLGPTIEFSATKDTAPIALREQINRLAGLRHASRFEQSQAVVDVLDVMVSARLKELHRAGCIEAMRPAAQSELFRRCQIGDAYIRAHFMEDVTVSSVAEVAMLSRAHFLRSFTRFFAETPAKLIQRLRLNHAAGMLRRGECDVSTASLTVGYSNLSAFSRAFRTRYAMTPTAYASRQAS